MTAFMSLKTPNASRGGSLGGHPRVTCAVTVVTGIPGKEKP